MSLQSPTSAGAAWLVVLALLAASMGASTVAASGQTGTVAPGAGPEGYEGALPWELPEDAERMVVHRVVDGDTVQLTYPNDDWYYPTRIIGIQAPELDGPYTDEQCFGDEARDRVTDLLPSGETVYVQRDRTDEDRNGRRLRHLFVIDRATGDAYLLSEILVLGGYTDARAYPPDDLYDDVLQEAEGQARKAGAGIWSACGT